MYHIYPLRLLLLMCCDIVANCVDHCNVLIVMRYKHQHNKGYKIKKEQKY